MVLLDFLCVVFVCGALLAAAITGRFGRDALPVARDMLLPAGVAGTFLGFIQMLQQMDDPTAILPAISVGLLTTLYAAVLKFGLHVRLSTSAIPTPPDPGAYGRIAAILWLVVVIVAILGGSPVTTFFDTRSLVLFVFGALSIALLTRVSGGQDIPAALVRFLPGVGLLILYASIVAVLPVLEDPSKIGPIVAWGLLGHFYCQMTTIVLHLTHPHRVKRESTVSQWLVAFASIGGICVQMALIGLAVANMS